MSFEMFKIEGSYSDLAPLPEGAKISSSGLRLITADYIGFDGKLHNGQLVCAKDLAAELMLIFRELLEAGYPIEKIEPSCVYGGDDDKIMAANVTSCFNYRTVANTDTLSLHALGRAVDINPLYNPYIQNGIVMPENAAPYADRSADFPHKITHDDTAFRVFAKYGWLWGGDWTDDKDYQHFYKPENRLRKLIRKL